MTKQIHESDNGIFKFTIDISRESKQEFTYYHGMDNIHFASNKLLYFQIEQLNVNVQTENC